jgi:5-methyltetrahydrofolate--homocysteine methyltransferase
MKVLADIALAVEKGDHETVATLTQQALDAGANAATVLDDGLLAGMQVVGERFREHLIFLPDVLLAARALYAGLDLIEPLLAGDGAANRGAVVLGTVRGDLHDIGKNLVAIMLRGAGYRVVDLGTDVPPERFVDAAVDEAAPVIGLSAMLTTTMGSMAEVVDEISKRGLSEKIRVVIGGAPVNADFAREIGAAAYAFDAANAVETVRTISAVS